MPYNIAVILIYWKSQYSDKYAHEIIHFNMDILNTHIIYKSVYSPSVVRDTPFFASNITRVHEIRHDVINIIFTFIFTII